MDGIIGADVADLRDFAKTMDKASNVLMQQAQTLSNVVNQPRGWKGPDADRFRQTWNSSHRSTLASTARNLLQVSEMLRKNADEQETASSVASMAGGAGGDGVTLSQLKNAYDAGMVVTGAVTPLMNAWKLHKLGAEDWAKTKELLTNWDDAGRVLKGGLDELKNGGKIGDVLSDLKAGIPYSQAFDDASKFSKGLRIVGGLTAPLSIAGGIHDMISPEHEGWRGGGDRVAGGLSVVGGVGSIMLMTAGGAALLGPIGAPIVIAAGIAAGAWALGNLVADNWDGITNFTKDVSSKVVNGVADAAKSTGKFLKGIFG